MNADEIKRLIQQILEDPSVAGAERDETDQLLVQIIRVEKKHLYGIHQTSQSRRQDEIEKIIEAGLNRGSTGDT